MKKKKKRTNPILEARHDVEKAHIIIAQNSYYDEVWDVIEYQDGAKAAATHLWNAFETVLDAVLQLDFKTDGFDYYKCRDALIKYNDRSLYYLFESGFSFLSVLASSEYLSSMTLKNSFDTVNKTIARCNAIINNR